MSETERIVALGHQAAAQGEKACLATVVYVEGSSYRKPGARMLVTSSGERAGTISGGCLESEVSRKAWWLTRNGPCVERYESFPEEDGSAPYGLGCGGTVSLLLEGGEPAAAVLAALEQVISTRQPAAVIMGLGGEPYAVNPPVGTLAVLRPATAETGDVEASQLLAGCAVLYQRPGLPAGLATAAQTAFEQLQSFYLTQTFQPYPGSDAGSGPAYLVEYLAPPPAVTIFGAGDDAQPIVALARALGWRVSVADGRAHLARRDRFPLAAEVRVLNYADPLLRVACGIASDAPVTQQQAHGPAPAADANPQTEALCCDEIAILLTHSYEQDRALLTTLLPRPLRYLGVLGPRHRTERLLEEIAPRLGLTVDQAFARLHSPVGLDLGARDPASIALSILAEIQAVLHGRQVDLTRTKSLSGEAYPMAATALAKAMSGEPSLTLPSLDGGSTYRLVEAVTAE